MSKVYQILTDKVLSLIDKGVTPWRKGWVGGMAPANYKGRPYGGCNLFLLSILCEFEGWEHPVFLTYKQIEDMGGTIKEDQKKRHNPVFFWNWNFEKVDPVTGDKKKIPIFRFFSVWNIAQVDGISLPKWAQKPKKAVTPIDACEAIVTGYANAPKISHGGHRAYYNPPLDSIKVPQRDNFKSSEEYYSTLFHELGHSTGHKDRLNRKGVTDAIRYGSHEYSQEELVAELTATYLCAEAGIANESLIENQAAYLAGWWKALKEEPKMFATAAAQAVKAAKHILGTTEDATEVTPTDEEAAREAA